MSPRNSGSVLGRTKTRPLHLLVRDRVLRSSLEDVLSAGPWSVEQHTDLSELWTAAHVRGTVAVVDWTAADGLLSEEHRHDLAQLSQRMRVVVLVPEAWLRHLSAEDIGVAALVPKAWAPDALLPALETLATV